jgi:hypothetical protein
MSNYDAFCKKHEAGSFGELVFNDPHVEQYLRAYAGRRNYDNVLLYGPYGSAKSSTAKVIIEERQRVLGINNVMVEHYEALDIRGKLHLIESSVNLILGCQHMADMEPYVLIDEVDHLTPMDQLDLRAIINTLPVGKLILTTNNFGKLDGGLISRCDPVEVLLPTPEQFVPRAHQMLAAEGVADSSQNLLSVMSNASLTNEPPSMRDIMRALFQRVQVLKQANVQSPQVVPAHSPNIGSGTAAISTAANTTPRVASVLTLHSKLKAAAGRSK